MKTSKNHHVVSCEFQLYINHTLFSFQFIGKEAKMLSSKTGNFKIDGEKKKVCQGRTNGKTMNSILPNDTVQA